MKLKLIALTIILFSFFFMEKVSAYQIQPIFDTGKVWSSASSKGISWADVTGFSSSKVQTIVMALANGDAGVSWDLLCMNRSMNRTIHSEKIVVTDTDFYAFNFIDGIPENELLYCYLSCSNGDKQCGWDNYAWHLNIFGADTDIALNSVPFGSDPTPIVDYYYEVFTEEDIPTPFEITSHETGSLVVEESWTTVTGTCPVVGDSRIGLTNDCLGFADITYDISCIDNTFSGEFYKSTLSDKLIARDISSVSSDCVDYDSLMDTVTLSGLEIIEGYPDDWYFNFDYYDDYNIKIHSPNFDTAITLPLGTTSSLFTFGFIYPTSSVLSNLTFTIKQYDRDGNILNSGYHSKMLSDMPNTWNYPVTLTASSTQSLHYVVQLTNNGETVRQYPFGIYVSDLEYIYNPDDFDYFFPRLVEMLREKIVFNYYFAFHDGFYDMFNGNYEAPASDDLDITFKSVSGDGEYDLDIKIFSASDTRVKQFASGVRPYIVAILWLLFAAYVVVRITHLFSSSDNEQ